MNRRVIKAIIRKDVFDTFKSPHAFFNLVLPIVTLLLFKPVFDADTNNTLVVAVFDPGNSAFVRTMDEAPLIDVVRVNSLEELQLAVQGKVIGGLALPSEDFDADLKAGEQPSITLYTDSQSGAINFQRLVEQQLYPFAGYPLPVTIEDIDVSAGKKSASFRPSDYLLILTFVMALAIAGVSVVPSLLVEEKEKHTLQAILVIPSAPGEITLAKALVGLFYGLLAASILFVLDQGWRGDWSLTIVTILSGAFFMVAVGVYLGVALHTSAQLNIWSSIVMLILMVPSWLWLPVLTLPAPVEFLFRFIPTYYLTHTLRLSLSGQASLAQIGISLLILWGSTIALLVAVAWQLQRGEQQNGH